MSDKSRIEWTETTWNPVTGCTKVSRGCKNCYALRDWARLSANPQTVYYGREFTDVMCHPERLEQPLRWTKPRRIFVNSMSDLFHEDVPDDFIEQIFNVMEKSVAELNHSGNCGHVFQILTKRPERMRDFVSRWWRSYQKEGVEPYMGYIWLGVSVEDQATADERIPLLLQTPAAVRWLSMEPLLGPVDLNAMSRTPGAAKDEITADDDRYGPPLGGDNGIDWVVVGGESGFKARPMHPDWVRSLRDQCQAAGVPFFFKQWGEWLPGEYPAWPETADYLDVSRKGHFFKDDRQWMDRVGKKAAGRTLDGRTWDEYPEGAR